MTTGGAEQVPGRARWIVGLPEAVGDNPAQAGIPGSGLPLSELALRHRRSGKSVGNFPGTIWTPARYWGPYRPAGVMPQPGVSEPGALAVSALVPGSGTPLGAAQLFRKV